MKKLLFASVFIFFVSELVMSCKSRSSNNPVEQSIEVDKSNDLDQDELYVWLVNSNDSIEVDTLGNGIGSNENNEPTKPSDFSIIILDRVGPNCDEHCDPNVLAGTVKGEYTMNVPSSYSDEEVRKVLIDSIVSKKSLPARVTIKEFNPCNEK